MKIVSFAELVLQCLVADINRTKQAHTHNERKKVLLEENRRSN